MKRSFSPPARGTLGVLVGALVCGAGNVGSIGCTPNHDVKAGAPELIEFNIVQAGPGGLSATMITPDTPECSSLVTGDACLPTGKPADPAAGTDMIPADSVCRLASADNWCRCFQTDPMNDPSKGAWDCDPFANVTSVAAVFDRLLDSAPLDPGDAGGLTAVVTATAGSAATAVDLVSDYSSTGDSKGVIFNVFGPFFGNFRADGPSLLSLPQPEFPSGATVTVNLDAKMILAKDGTTPFTAGGLLSGNSVVFTMAPFTVSLIPPDSTPMAADPVTATVAFTNFLETPGCFTDDDPMTTDMPCATAAHISATSNGASITVNVATGDGTTFTVTPKGGAWPAGAAVVITVDAVPTNLLGQPIDMAHSFPFTAP